MKRLALFLAAGALAASPALGQVPDTPPSPEMAQLQAETFAAYFDAAKAVCTGTWDNAPVTFEACNQATSLLAQAIGNPDSRSQIALAFAWLCIAGEYGPACTRSGEILEHGELGVVVSPDTLEDAAYYYGVGCDFAQAAGCAARDRMAD